MHNSFTNNWLAIKDFFFEKIFEQDFSLVINGLDVYSRFTNMLLEGAMFVYIGSIYYQNNTIEGLSKSETKSVAFMFYVRFLFLIQRLINN